MSTTARAVADVATTATAAGTAKAVGTQPVLVSATVKDVLAYLAGRISSKDNIYDRLSDASIVALAELKGTTTAVHAIKGEPGLLSKVLPSPQPNVPPMLSLGIATLKVLTWHRPTTGSDEIRLGWPMTGATDAPTPTFVPGKPGLVVIPPQQADLLEQVRAREPSVYLWLGGPSPMIAGVDPEAVKQLLGTPEQLVASPQKSGLPALLALSAWIHHQDRPKALKALKALIADTTVCGSARWGARAALWHLGDQGAASVGLDDAAVGTADLGAFGMTLQRDQKGAPWAFSGPRSSAPVSVAAWTAKGQCP